MEPEQPQNELPPYEPIVDTGGRMVLPYPRQVTLRGSPFHVSPSSYVYVSQRAKQSVRKMFLSLIEPLSALGVRLSVNSDSHLAPTQVIFTDSAQFPKWAHLEATLKGDAARPDGYRISVNQDGIMLHGSDDNGLQYACTTLLQLLEDGPSILGMEIEDYPLLPYRAIHLDCKGWPPRVDWLKRTIETLAAIKINVLIVEYEAQLDYPSAPGLCAEGAITAADVAEIEIYARERGVALVPLLSCPGNAGHVLSKPEYAALREHPGYSQMYCPSNPDALNLLFALMSDLLPLHPGKMLHIGGDGAFLMGSNPATLKRAEEIGGLDAVYLEFIGLLCRFLVDQGFQPLMWDENLRQLSDEQIKWLPTAVTPLFYLPEGLSPAIAQDVLAHLERYKVLGRKVWGAAVLTPSRQFGAFDNLDAWAEVGELNYIGGLCATVRAREFANCGLLPPLEAAWPAIFYAAERAWSGRKAVEREMFPQRFVTRFFGLRDPELQSQMWAGFDRSLAGNALDARAFFKATAPRAAKNPDTARFMESWSAVTAAAQILIEIEAEIRENFANIQSGAADPLQSGRLRWRLQELKTRIPEVMARFTHDAAFFSSEMAGHEYIESATAYTMRRLEELEPLLAPYPLPAENWREPGL